MRISITKRLSASAIIFGLSLAGAVGANAQEAAAHVPAYVARAVNDAARPAADRARDASRKPEDMMTFAHVRPGQTVLELIPGRGYFTRILSQVVGPEGHVYSANPSHGSGDAKAAATSLSTDPHYANVSEAALPEGLATVPPVDVVWTAQNYHDFHLARLNSDVAALDKTLFNAVKPGGEFIVIDHAAVAGSGLDVPDKLHRIDEEIVKKEVESAGFVFEAEDNSLRNPADPRTALVFAPEIRGHTDQFVLRFRKPKDSH